MTPSQVQAWREPTWRVVSNQKKPTDKSSDNPTLFTATYLVNCDDLTSEKQVFVNFINACQVERGLFNRYPGDLDLNSWDEMIGLTAASVKLGLNYHHDILLWGEDNNWTWNNPDPSKEPIQAFLGRYPAFIPFLQMACGHTPTPVDEVLYAGANEASAMTPVGNESGKCLQYLMNKTIFGKRPEIDLSIWIWRELMKKKYPGGMKDVYASYFGAFHPFALYGPADFT
jgi:hypothetical protein